MSYDEQRKYDEEVKRKDRELLLLFSSSSIKLKINEIGIEKFLAEFYYDITGHYYR
jgi:hypothetical protein